MDTQGSPQRLTLGRALAALGACALLAITVPPSLEQFRTRLQPVTCANNLRACHQAWNVYGHQYGGVWMAPWDWGNLDGDGYDLDQQWPYTMNIYAAGYSLPDGQDVYMLSSQLPGGQLGGWWTPNGRGSVTNLPKATSLQCPTLKMGPPTNPWWHSLTNYSYAVMGGRVSGTGQVVYGISYYPIPDQMTHPATTMLLHDLGGTVTEGGSTQAWTAYLSPSTGEPLLFTTDPHDGKSNYLMCDGHVELLAFEDLNETMWMSLWVPEEPQP